MNHFFPTNIPTPSPDSLFFNSFLQIGKEEPAFIRTTSTCTIKFSTTAPVVAVDKQLQQVGAEPPSPREPSEEMEWEFRQLAETSSERLSYREDETYLLATSSFNIHKNRYRDVLPLGYNGNTPSRVKLQPFLGVEGSDYINANHIDIRDKRYISCQAPLPHTFGDFWRMIWEQEVTVVVMLTSLVENDKVKAHAYWPAVDKTHRFGSLSVTLLEESYDCGIMTRKLNITKLDENSNDCSASRQITQLHFCEWPDHGVPRTCSGIRRLVHLSHFYLRHHQHQQGVAGPVVVHCSAGIGRAGTLIAIDLMLDVLHSSRKQAPFHREQQCVEENSPKTVFDTVRMLRQRRKGMIQTLDQYKFIFRVLEDYKTVDSSCASTPMISSSPSPFGESKPTTEAESYSSPRLLRSSANILRITGVNLPHYRSPKETPQSHNISPPSMAVVPASTVTQTSRTTMSTSVSAKRNALSWTASPARPIRKTTSTTTITSSPRNFFTTSSAGLGGSCFLVEQ